MINLLTDADEEMLCLLINNFLTHTLPKLTMCVYKQKPCVIGLNAYVVIVLRSEIFRSGNLRFS